MLSCEECLATYSLDLTGKEGGRAFVALSTTSLLVIGVAVPIGETFGA